MIRLVCSQGKISEDKEYVKYMASVASRAISEALEYRCSNDTATEDFLDVCYGEEFFDGIGQYFKKEDREVGYTIFDKKIDRMLEKLSDTSEVYTFDLIEERIFYDLVCELSVLIDTDIETHNERQEDADSLARTLCRVGTMGDENEDETNLFFWDDYMSFFEEGLEKGIKRISKAETLGYGYDYTVAMFEDIGIKAPMLWIGSKEGNKLDQEYVNSSKAIAERLDELMKGEL